MKKRSLITLAAVLALCSSCSISSKTLEPFSTIHIEKNLYTVIYDKDGSIISAQFELANGDKISISEFAHPNGYEDSSSLTYKFDGITYSVDPLTRNIETSFDIGSERYSIDVVDGYITLTNQHDFSTQAVALLPEGGTYAPIHIAGLDDYAILLNVPPKEEAGEGSIEEAGEGSITDVDVSNTIYAYVLNGSNWNESTFLLPNGQTTNSLSGLARRKFISQDDLNPNSTDETIGNLEICLPSADERTAALYSVTYTGGQLQLTQAEIYPDGMPTTWHF